VAAVASDHYHHFFLFLFVLLFFVRLSMKIPESPPFCKPQFQSLLSLFPFIFIISSS
jgi:hypothetical protein